MGIKNELSTQCFKHKGVSTNPISVLCIKQRSTNCKLIKKTEKWYKLFKH